MLSRINLHNKIKPHAAKFHAIGNTTRLSILYILAREPMEFGHIARRLKLRPSLAAHHLKQLVNVGWVTKIKVGKLATYYLSEDSVKEMSTFLRKFVSPQSESN
jgi:DNA-binding transcriptional ArsR family regulator